MTQNLHVRQFPNPKVIITMMQPQVSWLCVDLATLMSNELLPQHVAVESGSAVSFSLSGCTYGVLESGDSGRYWPHQCVKSN